MNSTPNSLVIPSGTSFTTIESASKSGGERIEFEVTMPPGAAGPPRHFHPRQHESWRVLQGELTLMLDGQDRALTAGEEATIPPGTVHTFANRGAVDVRFRDLHSPALDFQDYIETLARLTAEGKLTSRSKLVRQIYGSMVLSRHRTTQLSASRSQRAVESFLALVGRVLGYRIEAQREDNR